MNINDFNLTTTLSIVPSKEKIHDQPYFLRGASATLSYNLTNKVYNFSDIDQITFLLKQGKLLYWYKMFTYLEKTSDTEVIPGKLYFSDVKQLTEESLLCEGMHVSDPTGNPSEKGYFETVGENHSWRDTKYILDPRFSHSRGDGYEYVTLVLFPEDTKHFKPTAPNCGIDYEVVVRLNTDQLVNLANQDSTIIEPQHPIAVVDTLYGQI